MAPFLQALYENMLVELPLASFFLSKLLGQKSANVDIDHLQSLDPELYKNLLYLKNYDGDVQDLGLDFTIVSEEVGQAHVEEMKPGGANIPVTNENRIEYIHLIADFKLNRQIRSQCVAFRYLKFSLLIFSLNFVYILHSPLRLTRNI